MPEKQLDLFSSEQLWMVGVRVVTTENFHILVTASDRDAAETEALSRVEERRRTTMPDNYYHTVEAVFAIREEDAHAHFFG